MSITYIPADFLIRIKNAAMAGKKTIEVDKTNLIEAIASTLKREGFLHSVEVKDNKLIVELSYHQKKPAIIDIKIVSKPGLRVYMQAKEIRNKKSPSILIISSSKGIISSSEAIKSNSGGEVLAEIT